MDSESSEDLTLTHIASKKKKRATSSKVTAAGHKRVRRTSARNAVSVDASSSFASANLIRPTENIRDTPNRRPSRGRRPSGNALRASLDTSAGGSPVAAVVRDIEVGETSPQRNRQRSMLTSFSQSIGGALGQLTSSANAETWAPKFVTDDNGNDVLQDCPICLEENRRMCRTTSVCAHAFCEECVCEYVCTEAFARFGAKVTCPSQGCKEQFSDADIRRILSSRGVYDRYTRLKRIGEVARSEDSAWCATPGCDTVLSTRWADVADSNPLVVRDRYADNKRRWRIACPKCTKGLCSQCQLAWHPPSVTCAEQRRENEESVSLNARPCPSCQLLSAKVQGCNHIACPSCSAHWCYLCGAHPITYDHFGGESCRLFDQGDVLVAPENRWKIYLCFCLSSPIWIPLLILLFVVGLFGYFCYLLVTGVTYILTCGCLRKRVTTIEDIENRGIRIIDAASVDSSSSSSGDSWRSPSSDEEGHSSEGGSAPNGQPETGGNAWVDRWQAQERNMLTKKIKK